MDKIEDYKDIEIAPEEVENPPEGYTAQEWGGLNDAEKAVALDEIANPEGKEPDETEENLKAIAGEEDDAKKKADEEAAAKAMADAEAEKAKVTPSPEGGEAPPADKSVLTDEELLSHRFTVETRIAPDETVPIPDDLQEKIDELDEKFDTGDIDQKEYNAKVREIDRQATARFMQAKEAEKSDLAWDQAQGLFLRNRPEYLGQKNAEGKFESTEESAILYGALGKAIDTTQTKNPGLSYMEILVRADKAVKKMFTKQEAAPQKKDDAPAKKVATKPPAKMPDDFVTLGDIPTAGKEGTEGTFDQLDKLSGKQLEAYMKKHPDLVDRYINDAGRG